MFQMNGDAYIGTHQQNSDWNDVKYKFNVEDNSSTLIKLFFNPSFVGIFELVSQLAPISSPNV